jgi:CRISPR-associated protein Csb1
MSQAAKSPNQFLTLLEPDGPVAITLKQTLVTATDGDPVIFPPSYPMPAFKGRVHTVQDGDYRVSVELPPDSKLDKGNRASEKKTKPGYNIDRFPDGTSLCEIDSPQSQANRIEPIFSRGGYQKLVPQIEIEVGKKGTKVNLLVEASHRAADAVVRMSSLADKFHNAFVDAKGGNHFTLATVAPTSLVFGVWDSRSTRVKIQRIVRAQIRATNVCERTRSAQFTPAAEYVAEGAVDEDPVTGGEDSALSQEGLKHVPVPCAAGGVMLTSKSELTRTVALNLAALRELRGADPEHTNALQRYILGLALLATTADPDLNLREGCNLRLKDADQFKKVHRRGEPEPIQLDPAEIEKFAEDSAKEFFTLAEIKFDAKDHLDAIFESGVAEKFLAKDKGEREKISRLGPITAETIRRFEEQGKDPFGGLQRLLAGVKKAIGKAPNSRDPRIRNVEAFERVAEAFNLIAEDPNAGEELKGLAAELEKLAAEHEDSHKALKDIQEKLKAFRKAPRNQNPK